MAGFVPKFQPSMTKIVGGVCVPRNKIATILHTLDSLIDDTHVINDTHGKYPKKIKRHPCNKRHSGQLSEKELKDTQSIKRHSGHSRAKCLSGTGICTCVPCPKAQNGINVQIRYLATLE